MTIQHNKEFQLKHFGGNVTVFLLREIPFTILILSPAINMDEESSTLFDVHSFLSDNNTQITDGCAKQYKCLSTALYFMSYLSFKHNLGIERAIGCPGHGK